MTIEVDVGVLAVLCFLAILGVVGIVTFAILMADIQVGAMGVGIHPPMPPMPQLPPPDNDK